MSKIQREKFLEVCCAALGEIELSKDIKRAFIEVPRERFFKTYRLRGSDQWHTVTESNLGEHLPVIFQNQPITLVGGMDTETTSTISMPSFVLRMLHMLDLKPGHKVFEVGTGSGYNAALMGQLVGEQGRVYSSEIISDIAKQAKAVVTSLGLDNVEILDSDGGLGYAAGAPYDRIIYTAGAYDFPQSHFDQLIDGGRVLFVLKNRVGGDATLFLLEKQGDCLHTIEALPCGFVAFTGKFAASDLDPIQLENLPEWDELRGSVVSQQGFWWGANSQGGSPSASFQSFLDLNTPHYQPLKDTAKRDCYGQNSYFGVWGPGKKSLTIAKNDELITYGNRESEQHFFELLQQWMRLGMPALNNLALEIYSNSRVPQELPGKWICRRKEATFVWSLKE